MKTLYDFIVESNMIEGIFDQPSDELVQAYETFLDIEKPTVQDVCNFVKVTQPGAVLRDNMSVPGVRVGSHIAPPSGPEIREQLQFILEECYSLWFSRMSYGLPTKFVDNKIWKLHCQYETLHPFTDGNGRSGRLIWLWCMGERAPLGFLHQFYYQTLSSYRI